MGKENQYARGAFERPVYVDDSDKASKSEKDSESKSQSDKSEESDNKSVKSNDSKQFQAIFPNNVAYASEFPPTHFQQYHADPYMQNQMMAHGMMQPHMYGHQHIMQPQIGMMHSHMGMVGQPQFMPQQMVHMQNPNMMMQPGFNQAGIPAANLGNNDGHTVRKEGNLDSTGRKLLEGEGYAHDVFNNVL